MKLNSCTFAGRLGHDPQIKSFDDGGSICELSVAVSAGFGDRATTSWVRAICFGKQADFARDNLAKGDLVIIANAEYKQRKYNAKDGGERTSHDFIVGYGGSVQKVWPKKGEEGQGTRAPAEKKPDPRFGCNASSAAAETDEDELGPW